MSDDLKPINTKVNPQLWHQARILALQQGVNVRDVLERALREYIEKQKTTS